MQVSVEEVSTLTRKLEVVLPREMVAGELNAAYDKLRNEVNLKGFRKGKVPRKVLEKNYGPKIEYEVADRLVQESYFDALGKSGLDAVVHPEVREHRFEDDGTFFYQAVIDIRPDFTLGEYKGVEVEQPEVEVSDEAVDQELELLRRENAPLRPVDDRQVVEGDQVVVDFAAYEKGEKMKHVGGQDFSVDVGSGQVGPEFEDNLKGLKAGEDATFTVDFPANFPNMLLADKSIEFAVSVKEVKERVLPELDDEFAKDVDGNIATLDELRQQIRQRRRQEMENARRGDLVDQVMKVILANHDFEVPPRLVAHEVDAMIKELESNLQNRGLSLEEAGINRDSLIDKYREGAEKRVRGDFVLKKIAEQEEIKVADDDIGKGFQRIADQYNMPVDEVKKYFHSRNELMPFIHELHTEKTLDFLVQEAKIKTVPASDPAAPESADGAADDSGDDNKPAGDQPEKEA